MLAWNALRLPSDNYSLKVKVLNRMKLFLLLSLELSEHCAVINRRRNGDLISSSETSNAPVMPGTEVARVTLSDSDSAPVPKFFNPDPEIFQI